MRPVYCDESIWIPVADGLAYRGWAVRTARDEGMLGEPDRGQLAHSVDNDRLMLPVDSLVDRQGLSHAGLIYVRQAGRRIGEVVKVVDAHLEEREDDDRSIHYL